MEWLALIQSLLPPLLSNSPKLLILFRPEMTLPPRRPMRIAGNMKRVPLSQDSVVKVTYIQVHGYKVNIHCHAQGIGARGRAAGLNGTRGQSPCSQGSLCSGALAFSFVLVLAATREDRSPRTGQRNSTIAKVTYPCARVLHMRSPGRLRSPGKGRLSQVRARCDAGD